MVAFRRSARHAVPPPGYRLVGLRAADEAWDSMPFADEYDASLRRVAADLRHGRPFTEAVQYLQRIEREHTALGVRSGQEARAGATARAIQRFVVPSA